MTPKLWLVQAQGYAFVCVADSNGEAMDKILRLYEWLSTTGMRCKPIEDGDSIRELMR